MSAELSHLREQIDEVDKSLLDLLAKRLQLVAEVGEVKSQHGYLSMSLSVNPVCWQLVALKRSEWGFRLI
ncbi:T-protein [Providencia alcalifaciens]|nr:T-protein [Providencia alcalifaciens]